MSSAFTSLIERIDSDFGTKEIFYLATRCDARPAKDGKTGSTFIFTTEKFLSFVDLLCGRYTEVIHRNESILLTKVRKALSSEKGKEKIIDLAARAGATNEEGGSIRTGEVGFIAGELLSFVRELVRLWGDCAAEQTSPEFLFDKFDDTNKIKSAQETMLSLAATAGATDAFGKENGEVLCFSKKDFFRFLHLLAEHNRKVAGTYQHERRNDFMGDDVPVSMVLGEVEERMGVAKVRDFF